MLSIIHVQNELWGPVTEEAPAALLAIVFKSDLSYVKKKIRSKEHKENQNLYNSRQKNTQ